MKKNKVKYKIIAIIPARSDSKGLPQKNIRPLGGKPLMVHTIRQALKSRYLDRVFVSTDNREFAAIARREGAFVPLLRPKSLAMDHSLTSDVILHALQWFQKKRELFDIVVLLEPTSPLRKTNDIDKAIKFFLENKDRADSLVSCGQVYLEHPLFMKKIEKGYLRPFLKNKQKIHQRQKAPPVYFPYGVIYVSKVNTYKKFKTFYQKRTIPYIIERWQNYEIDDIFDFLCVETVLKHKIQNESA